MRVGLVAAVLILTLTAAITAPASLSFDGPGPTQTDDGILAQLGPEGDNTITHIDVNETGAGAWTIQIRTRLETDQAVEEYEAFQDAFRANASERLATFRERITNVVEAAADELNRSMSATAFDVGTRIQEVPRQWGIVEYEYTWIGFGAVSDDEVAVGDVFGGGFYLAEDDALEIAAPAAYTIDETAPSADEVVDGVATWYGREDFLDGQPHLVATANDDGGGTSGDGIGPAPILAFGGVVLILAGLGIAWRHGHLSGLFGREDDTDAHETESTDADVTPTVAPDDLRSDEDRVMALLEERGGRMKQAELAEALEWSDSKTSRVITEMAEAGELRKFRLGRENIVEFADEDDGGSG